MKKLLKALLSFVLCASMEVQKQIDEDEWVTVLTDTDPYTTFRCVSSARDGWCGYGRLAYKWR